MGEWLGGPAYLWLKALHILAVIAWMAGLLYLPRLFVYHHTAKPGGELESALIKQEERLLRIIMNPAMIAAWVLALLMLWGNSALFSQGWMHVKFLAVIALSGLHGFYAASRRKFAAGERPRTEKFWRMMNEVPFVLAIVIVIMAVVEPF